MNRFTIEQSEIEIESQFASRLWSVVHDVPVLYDALLEELAWVGLSSMDLRPDSGDGAVGGAGLGVWLFGGKANARISLEGCRFQTSSTEPRVVDSVDGVIGAVQQASPGLGFRSHAVSYACHGLIEGMRAADFVRRFVPNSVSVAGFGDCLGAGAALYCRRSATRNDRHVDPGRLPRRSGWSLRPRVHGDRRRSRSRLGGPGSDEGTNRGGADGGGAGERLTESRRCWNSSPAFSRSPLRWSRSPRRRGSDTCVH